MKFISGLIMSVVCWALAWVLSCEVHKPRLNDGKIPTQDPVHHRENSGWSSVGNSGPYPSSSIHNMLMIPLNHRGAGKGFFLQYAQRMELRTGGGWLSQ